MHFILLPLLYVGTAMATACFTLAAQQNATLSHMSMASCHAENVDKAVRVLYLMFVIFTLASYCIVFPY
ncbi:hypothetical protein BKA56DRAFT_592629 [Ilyonectria sp. MPI-CAGE-AT-0026]|nr:hypothetical protein BKA56DRAFT_592629 [Ilyonectria sp. MPI-CAGE-AT-0026]